MELVAEPKSKLTSPNSKSSTTFMILNDHEGLARLSVSITSYEMTMWIKVPIFPPPKISEK